MSLIKYIPDKNIIWEVDENNTKSSNLTEKIRDKIESISISSKSSQNNCVDLFDDLSSIHKDNDSSNNSLDSDLEYEKEEFLLIKKSSYKTISFGEEFILWDLGQKCSFVGAKMAKNEFCIIWRDNNFSSKPVYNNDYDPLFKNFLKERLKYLEQCSNYNIFPWERSDEAIELIKKIKYNKIILISNVGIDLEGREFIDEARKIIGNDIIVLFLAYSKRHLKWIKNYKNALYSNVSSFWEKYINCFNDEFYDKERKILELKQTLENHYKVKFNFDDKFLDYTKYKN